MQFLRKTGLVLAASLLPLLLFLFGLFFSLYQVYSTPDNIKEALKKSGFYNTIISDVLSEVKVDEGGDGVPVNDPEIKKIVGQAASPAFLEEQTTTLLDSFYAWVRGETETLNINIDLREAKARLSDGLAAYGAQRMAALPVCTEVPAEEIDALNATCLPPGFDQAAAAQEIKNKVSSGEFLEDAQITKEDIKSDQGETLEQQLRVVPEIYDKIVMGLWIDGLLIVLLTAAVVFLSTTWRSGLRRAGILFTVIGGITILIAWGSNFTMKYLSEAIGESEGKIQATVADIVEYLASDLRLWWMGYGMLLLVLGVGTLVTLKFVKAGKNAEQSEKPTGNDAPKHDPESPKHPHTSKTA
jgi:hypothetical protein